jgi:hypothetical protein
MILSTREFIGLYETTVKENPERTYKFCYEFAETVHVALFGERKYSDHNSFKQVLINQRK